MYMYRHKCVSMPAQMHSNCTCACVQEPLYMYIGALYELILESTTGMWCCGSHLLWILGILF